MRRQGHLVLFAKAPRLGRVKRRLACQIGNVPALRFHHQTTAAMLKKLSNPHWRLWLFLTPDDAGGIARVWPQAKGAHRMGQGAGDLGQRMARVFQNLSPGPIVLIGSDIPDIAPGDIRNAFRALESHDAVFGPSPDGGYWLVGFRRRVLPFHPFRGVRWSSPHALADTLGNLSHLRVAQLASREDVDTGSDYRRWCQRQKLKASVPEGGA